MKRNRNSNIWEFADYPAAFWEIDPESGCPTLCKDQTPKGATSWNEPSYYKHSEEDYEYDTEQDID